MNRISKELLEIAKDVNKIYHFNEYLEGNEPRYENKTERNFKSKNSMDGFIQYLLEDQNILGRITGDINIDKKTIALQTFAKEYDEQYYIMLKPNYGQSTLNIKLKNDKITNEFITNKTVRNWNDAKKFIIYLIDNLEKDNKSNKTKTSKINKFRKATYGLMFDNPDAPKHEGDFPILKIKVTDSDIINSQFYDQMNDVMQKECKEWKESNFHWLDTKNCTNQEKQELKDYMDNVSDIALDSFADEYIIQYIRDVIDGLKKLAKKGTTYMSGNFADWSEYYDMKPMNNAKDVINAAHASLHALGTFGFTYNLSEGLNSFFYDLIENDVDDEDVELSEKAIEVLKNFLGKH